MGGFWESHRGVPPSPRFILRQYLSLCPSDPGGHVPRATAARVGRVQFIVRGVWSLTLVLLRLEMCQELLRAGGEQSRVPTAPTEPTVPGGRAT